MFGENLPGKPFLVASLETSPFLALGYLSVLHYLKFAKFRAMMFLAQPELKTLPPSFFFTPSSSSKCI